MAMHRILLPAALTAALAYGAAASVHAQQTPPPRAPTTPSQPSQAVTDKDIQAFAAASSEVRQLKQKWAPQYQAAAQQGPEAQQKIENQAMAEMSGAVQKSGLSVERYNQIYDMAQNDPDVQRRVQQHSK